MHLSQSPSEGKMPPLSAILQCFVQAAPDPTNPHRVISEITPQTLKCPPLNPPGGEGLTISNLQI